MDKFITQHIGLYLILDVLKVFLGALFIIKFDPIIVRIQSVANVMTFLPSVANVFDYRVETVLSVVL